MTETSDFFEESRYPLPPLTKRQRRESLNKRQRREELKLQKQQRAASRPVKKPTPKSAKQTEKQSSEWSNTSLVLDTVYPLTDNQARVFNAYEDGKSLLLHGCAGTGKSFLAIYLGLNDIIYGNNYKKLYIIRSAVSSREIGFMPGKDNDKMRPFEDPYYGLCSELFNRGDAYELLKHKGLVEFKPTSFLRGTTFNDAIVVVDECQNMTAMELHTVITRLGDNARLILCGDTKQDDLTNNKSRECSGLRETMNIFNMMGSVMKTVEFGVEDVVRGGFVKEYLKAKYKFESQ